MLKIMEGLGENFHLLFENLWAWKYGKRMLRKLGGKTKLSFSNGLMRLPLENLTKERGKLKSNFGHAQIPRSIRSTKALHWHGRAASVCAGHDWLWAVWHARAIPTAVWRSHWEIP